ncbi:LysM peptidoglycan-binding domain-containing protein [Viridibacillus sp. YIM B01967]|uniref:LysM peptidoglycan-binding domain-containing protein n=1 Tax=Viridibacillus soli TaxID=2798301 RepID=A0ABS1H4G5_9BACL|nr:LysM peptidoglycan-binding domain-containing protein [Viridibacillus soli]MBK3494296.1 LysM peptidoglycan-binding domain-containing protein [Viridibacillus soli]
MNWFKKNQYITLLFGVCMAFTMIFVITNSGNTSYKEIEIHNGDTLLSLANKYSGKMADHEWIEMVRNENNIIDDTIYAGHTLVVPEHDILNVPNSVVEVASDKK